MTTFNEDFADIREASLSEAKREIVEAISLRITSSDLLGHLRWREARYTDDVAAIERSAYLALDEELFGRLGVMPEMPRRANVEDLVHEALRRLPLSRLKMVEETFG